MNRELLLKVRTRCEIVGDCWYWEQGTSDSGMPIMGINGKTRQVRRLVYAATHGEVPAGKVVTPACEHKKCVSPKCLEAVTMKEVHVRAAARGAHSNPAKIMRTALAMRSRSEFSEEIVRRIREVPGSSSEVKAAIAAETGVTVSLSHLKNIRAHRARRDLSNPFAGLGARD